MEITKKYLQSLLPEKSYGHDNYAAFHQVLKGIKLEDFTLWISKDSSRITPTLEPKKLTLLHVCAMLGKKAYAEAVMARNVIDINAKDSSGWTVLHFASFINDTALQTFFASQGALPTLNVRGALPSKLQELAYPPKKKLTFSYEEGGKIIEGDNTKFQELTGKKLLDEIQISLTDLFNDWEKNEINEECYPPEWQQKYELFKRSPPPQLYLTFSKTVGAEVVSKDFIPAGTIFCEYIGDFYPITHPDSTDVYRLDDISGKKSSNLGPLINDGTPNITILPVVNNGGIFRRFAFMTLEDCPPGTVLRWNYGAHVVKEGKHFEVSTDTLFETYKKLREKHGPLDVAYKQVLKKISTISQQIRCFGTSNVWQTLDEVNLSEKVQYLVVTPHAQILLMIKKTISSEELMKCIALAQTRLQINPLFTYLPLGLSKKVIESLSKQGEEQLFSAATSKTFIELTQDLAPYYLQRK
ncbi:MAG: hypothetical protein JSR58_00290 [Verrucomicrobia bacterium]|nr:hypothetical protein [Verrucomicrobiota bacterium]